MLAEAVPGLTRRRHAVSPFSRCPAIHSDHRRHISPGTVAAARSYSRTRTCGTSDARRARSAGALRPEQPVALRVYALRTVLAPIWWTPGLCSQCSHTPVRFGRVRTPVAVGRVQPPCVVVRLDE